jgi:hypothetical protein
MLRELADNQVESCIDCEKTDLNNENAIFFTENGFFIEVRPTIFLLFGIL